jgi:hypothetical protein
MKPKNIFTVAALMVVSYTVGKCRGISKLGKTMDKVLKKDHGLHVDKICYDVLKGKIAVDLVADTKEEEKAE